MVKPFRSQDSHYRNISIQESAGRGNSSKAYRVVETLSMSPLNEKSDQLLPGTWPPPPPRRTVTSSSASKIVALRTGLVVLAVFASTFLWRSPFGIGSYNFHEQTNADICPQVSELIPSSNFDLWETLGDTYGTDAFKMRAVDWLAGAVRIP
jgi:Gly-Xaa carboxypeptidase